MLSTRPRIRFYWHLAALAHVKKSNVMTKAGLFLGERHDNVAWSLMSLPTRGPRARLSIAPTQYTAGIPKKVTNGTCVILH
jgi:lipoate synthase